MLVRATQPVEQGAGRGRATFPTLPGLGEEPGVDVALLNLGVLNHRDRVAGPGRMLCRMSDQRAVTQAAQGTEAAQVGVVMGSRSDFETMGGALDLLAGLGVRYEVRVLSAHRTPGLLASYGARAERLNFSAIIAGAGGAAHLPGMLAAFTRVPVLGVPVQSRALSGQDSLLSMVQMPAGVPVATFAIGTAGAKNAALFAAAVLATTDAGVRERLDAFRAAQTQAVLDDPFFEGHLQAGTE